MIHRCDNWTGSQIATGTIPLYGACCGMDLLDPGHSVRHMVILRKPDRIRNTDGPSNNDWHDTSLVSAEERRG